jgi:RimJ/RimL family protein N-acetyltransferase
VTPEAGPGAGARARARAWPIAALIETDRLQLEPLRVDHATELATVLDDERLHEFIGGRPATTAELRSRYTRLEAGRSPDGSQGWLNWVVRDRGAGVAVGTVQATLGRTGGLTAEIAWVIAAARQGRGYATEAAAAMVARLEQQSVRGFVAHIHPDHAASNRVARHLGLRPTNVMEDGEVRWVR